MRMKTPLYFESGHLCLRLTQTMYSIYRRHLHFDILPSSYKLQVVMFHVVDLCMVFMCGHG